MAKLTAQQKKQINQAKDLIQKAADILQEVQDGCDSFTASNIEEVGISLGFAINEIETSVL